MAVHTYIGARYVPRFVGTYDPTQIYEALDVVDNGSGTSYIARDVVPAGTPLTDTTHWFVYGASSGAIISLQNDMIQAQNDILSLQGDVSDIEDVIDVILGKTRNVITVSDSYGRTSDTGTSWEVELESYMGGTFHNYYAGSIGFVHVGDGGYTAQTLLTAHAGDIADPDLITDIVFGLGINDLANNETLASVGAAYDSLIAYCKTTYPNARIWFGFIGFTHALTLAQRQVYANYIALMADKCGEHNCCYLDGVEYIMHDISLQQADFVHPSANGSKEIAKGINCIMQGGCYTFKHSIPFSLTLTGGVAVVGGQITIDGPTTAIRYPAAGTASSLTFTGGDPLAIGTLSDHIILNGHCSQFVPIASGDAGAPGGMMLFNNGATLYAIWRKTGSHSIAGMQIEGVTQFVPTLDI